MFERFMEIDDHDDSRLDRDAKERNVADRYGNAEVVFEQPLQQQSATHRIDGREDEDKRFGYRVKDQVQQQENHEEDDRQNQLQPLLGAQFEFVLSRPLKGVVGWQSQFVVKELVRISQRSRRSRCF